MAHSRYNALCFTAGREPNAAVYTRNREINRENAFTIIEVTFVRERVLSSLENSRRISSAFSALISPEAPEELTSGACAAFFFALKRLFLLLFSIKAS